MGRAALEELEPFSKMGETAAMRLLPLDLKAKKVIGKSAAPGPPVGMAMTVRTAQMERMVAMRLVAMADLEAQVLTVCHLTETGEGGVRAAEEEMATVGMEETAVTAVTAAHRLVKEVTEGWVVAPELV